MGSPLARRPFCIRACLCKSNFSATHKRPDFGHLARWATSTCCLMYGCSPLSSRPLGVLTNTQGLGRRTRSCFYLCTRVCCLGILKRRKSLLVPMYSTQASLLHAQMTLCNLLFCLIPRFGELCLCLLSYRSI